MTQFDSSLQQQERDHPAPIDYGYGPGIRPPPHVDATQLAGRAMVSALASTPASVPTGTADSMIKGMFGPAVAWPIIPIHAVLLPDGRVMSYGSDATGKQGAMLYYDVWTPALGTGTDAHILLPNGTSTDIFCSGQSVMWANGEVLITGGDLTVNGRRNYSINSTSIFYPASNTLVANAPMTYARWYGSLVALPNGEMLVLGGRQDPVTPVTTPEIYNSATGWRTLTGATSAAAFGKKKDVWYYPRGFVTPSGLVFVLGNDGATYLLDPTGTGTITTLPQTTITANSNALPSVMYAPGKILAVRTLGQAIVADVNGATPLISVTGSLSQERLWSSATVMADGKVLVTGGSTALNLLIGADYTAEVWDPATGLWSLKASATKPRLYHSTALLLPDGSVLTGGGGAPGPVNNLNAEIYYPPYLYAQDGSGLPAARPTLVTAPASIGVGGTLGATVGNADLIGRVTVIRSGSVSHSVNLDQRFFDLPFVQTGTQITATLPTNVNLLIPGSYLMFVFNQAGTPSVASTVLVYN